MTLTPGTKLGPYEITAPLGAGGMGEVYRAKDTRLGRDVAVKVLPLHLSANADVRTRFEREAKTISSLNHPNICTLFDVGREGDTDYLVMELIEGETLAQRLLKGALPTADVLRIGGQIADALDRAHRAGVVHRDLKPGNVMLTRSGAKLMDFGLARASVAGGPVSASGATMTALTQSPTMASPLTAEGAIVGTFQYMAPEQLEGREADARSDLWALGCVLHEMATGRRAFDGKSQASLIAAIMHVVPAPVSAAAPMAPPALDRVVSACLTKDPADRIQSAHDVKLQLGWIAEPAAQSGVSPAPALPAAPGRAVGSSTRIAWVVAALAVIAAVWSLWSIRTGRPSTVVSQIAVSRGLAIRDYWSSAVISPDGERVVATAHLPGESLRLWAWRLDSPDPRVVEGTEGGAYPSWSPDSRFVAYVSAKDQGLCRIPVAGGGATRLCDASDSRGTSWGKKGVILFAPASSGPLMKVSASGGTPEVATELDASRGEGSHRFPVFLPDGEHFLFTAVPRGPNGFAVRMGSLGSRQSRVVLETESGATYVEPGYLIFVQGRKIMAQRFDARSCKFSGERFALDEAPTPGDMDAEPVVSASNNGRLVYLVNPRPASKLEWVDRQGLTRSTLALPQGDWWVNALSPDQKSVLATMGGDLWQVDLERAVPTRLLGGIDPYEVCTWSPDGKRIAATSRESGREVLRLINAGGSGARDSVPVVPALFLEAASWAADGKSLLTAVLGRTSANANANNSWDLYVAPLDGSPAKPYLATGAFERECRLSPDGHWVACAVRNEGKLDLFIDSYPEPGHRTQVFSGQQVRQVHVMWGRQGRELYYVDADNDLAALPVSVDGDVVRAGQPVKLFAMPVNGGTIDTRDGERFLVSREEPGAAGVGMRLVLGWEGLLKR